VIKKIYYNKLVRDKIPEIIEKSGGTAKFKKLTAKQFEKELLKKVGEESGALPGVKSKKELIDELADVTVVINEIKKLKKITEKDVKTAMQANIKRKGRFMKKLYLVWSEDTGYKTNERRYSKK
jgi:predicted house-cleaning noncanonical NTP pyrophosphatase (MazG superfamily)